MPVRLLRHSLAVCLLVIYLCGSSLLIVFAGRNLLGGVFPLVTNAMFTNLGYPEASSLLGGIVSQRIFHLQGTFR